MKGESGYRYDDIIDLPHHVSARHPRMSGEERAAQFSPFAALTGHGEAVRETERITDPFAEQCEDQKELLNRKLLCLKEREREAPEIEAAYYKPDERKSGGAYVTVRGRLKKIDIQGERLLFADGTAVPFERLWSVDGDVFLQMEETEPA